MTLLALALAALPAVSTAQNCSVELPFPPGNTSRLGRYLTASDDWVAAASFSASEFQVWQRTSGGDANLFATLMPMGGVIRSLDGHENRIAVLNGDSAGSYDLSVWEFSPAGVWIQGAPLTAPTNRSIAAPVAIEGNTLITATQSLTGGGQRRLAVYDRDALTGEWLFSQELSNPGVGGFAGVAGLENGRIYTSAGVFGDVRVQVFERAGGGAYAFDRDFSSSADSGFFSASGDRLAVQGDSEVDVWRRDGAGWVLEQKLNGPSLDRVLNVSLGDRWLACRVPIFTVSGPAPGPVRIFERPAGSQTWLATQPALPPGGMTGSTRDLGLALAIAGDGLFVTDEEFEPRGRVFGVDLSCLQAPPVLHWVSARLNLAPSTGWPSNGRTLEIATTLPFSPGQPYGTRGGTVSVRADYVLDILGLPCSQEYATSICANAAFALRDGFSGVTTAEYPIDPEGGFPQFFDTATGPSVPSSTSELPFTWPFVFEDATSVGGDLLPTGQPMDLQLAAQTYNCIDFGGIFVPDIPNVQAFGCGYVSLPTMVQTLSFEASVTGELAFDLPPLTPGLQGTICDGGVNGSGFRASLEAVGSSVLADNALYFGVTGLTPGTAGILFLSPQAATAPFSALGFGQLCLGSPLARVNGSVGLADESGHAALRLDLSMLPAGFQPQPGSTWAAQWMYRDQGFVNTTSARTVRFQ